MGRLAACVRLRGLAGREWETRVGAGEGGGGQGRGWWPGEGAGRVLALLDGAEVLARSSRHADAARGEVDHLIAVRRHLLVERGDAEMRPVVAHAGHELAEDVRLGDGAVNVGDDEADVGVEQPHGRGDGLPSLQARVHREDDGVRPRLETKRLELRGRRTQRLAEVAPRPRGATRAFALEAVDAAFGEEALHAALAVGRSVAVDRGGVAEGCTPQHLAQLTHLRNLRHLPRRPAQAARRARPKVVGEGLAVARPVPHLRRQRHGAAPQAALRLLGVRGVGGAQPVEGERGRVGPLERRRLAEAQVGHLQRGEIVGVVVEAAAARSRRDRVEDFVAARRLPLLATTDRVHLVVRRPARPAAPGEPRP